MIGGRDDFQFIKVASNLSNQEVAIKLSEIKPSGRIAFVRPPDCKPKSASDFDNPETRAKYFQTLMSEYFN